MYRLRGLILFSELSSRGALSLLLEPLAIGIYCFHDRNIEAPNGLGYAGKVTRLLPVETR